MFEINNKIYETKGEVANLIKNILYKYNIGDYVNSRDRQILLDLLKYHPNYEQKIGCGISGFKIYITQYKRRGFMLIRINRSSTDFSYIKCITNPSLFTKIKLCCRNAIKDDIVKFKNNLFNKKQDVICPITNKILTKNNCHIDHYNPTFKEIFDNWYKNKTITENDINQSFDNNETTFFTNESLKNNFRTFHNKIANLRAVSINANLSLLK